MVSSSDIIEKNISDLRDNLLDLSMRNKLLNFKPLKSTISIFKEDIGQIFKILVLDEKVMTFLPVANENLNEDDSVWIRPSNSYVPKNFTDSRLQTKFNIDELNKRLTKLFRDCNTIIEEQGYNNLFLALGFLEWNESDYSLKSYKAPLILVPVTLYRDSINKPYKLKYNSEDVRPNISLYHKLMEQGIELPLFETDFESVNEVYNYLSSVEDAISSKNDWNIINNIFLSNFNFKKFVMYQDLDLSNWPNSIVNNNISKLFDSENVDTKDKDYFFDEDDFKFDFKSSDVFHVLDADSSQISVLEYVKKGGDLVVEGPPGTGKSQTIVNLIAELIANDKKVLFVSEKKAALEVVKDRLDNIGLGMGCLELHSNKAKKRDVLDELNKTLNQNTIQVKDSTIHDDLDNITLELNRYMDDLYTKFGVTGFSTYDLFGMYEHNLQILEENNQPVLDAYMDDVINCELSKRGESIKLLDEVVNLYSNIMPISDNFWNQTNPENLTPQDMGLLSNKLDNILEDVDVFIDLSNKITSITSCKKFDNLLSQVKFESNFSVLQADMKILESNIDFDDIINKIEEFQLKSAGIDLKVLDLDLNDKINNLNNIELNINTLKLDESILNINLSDSLSEFKKYKYNIDSSDIKKALNDDNLEDKLNIFKTGKDSFFKKRFNSDFKKARDSLKSYYSTEVSDDRIIEDFTQILKWNGALTNIRNQLLAYCSDYETDEKIIVESEKLLSWARDIDEIKNEISSFFIKSKTITSDRKDIKINIQNLIELKNLKEYILANDNYGYEYFLDDWKGLNSNVNILRSKLEKFKNFKKLYDVGFFNDKTVDYLNNSPNLSNLNNLLTDFKFLYSEIIDKFNNLNNILEFNGEITINNFDKINIYDFKTFIIDLKHNIPDLNDYRNYKSNLIKSENELTKNILNLIDSDKVKPNCIIPLFNLNFAKNCLNNILSSNISLFNFNSKIHSEKIEKFKELDEMVLKHNIARIKEKLSSKCPNINTVTNRNSQLGILVNEINKKRRLLPLRKLLKNCKDVILDIKPCFMMSPISISQYLDPSVFESFFDYIIFDEASQVKVEDAISAMMRGKNYVIFGDRKQLPPTSFFDTTREEEEEYADFSSIKDDESILGTCALSFPSKMLTWHYRSRHESLIAVSNAEFYNNDLYVYPSPMTNSENLGLKLEYRPDTVYGRGTNSKNIKEAEYVVEYALNHFEKYGSNKSLGIGTFSVKQQTAIYDTLEIKLKEKPHLEKYFNSSGVNGFFIKNLENIQGDERDVILISVGYGFDTNHKLSLNFGPLNREGGERRLNVLVTRAKEKCVVFTNFKSRDLNVSNNKKGLIALKNFLYYAENQHFPPNYDTGEDFDSEFERSVYNFLDKNGYTVEKQIGCVGYKIDLAIRDPDNFDNYIIGIECDGAPYHSSPSARDRDRLRQNVLEGLGWKFHRIWSTDWYNNREKAKKTLLSTINETIQHKNDEKIGKKIINDYKPEIEVFKKEEIKKDFNNYYYYNKTIDSSIYDYDSNDLWNIINEILIMESPIHIEELYERMKKVFNQKNTKKFRNYINQSITNCMSINFEIKDNFLYYTLDNQISARFRKKPKIDWICDEEIEDAIKKALNNSSYLLPEDIPKEASTYLGFKTLNKNAKLRIEEIFQKMS